MTDPIATSKCRVLVVKRRPLGPSETFIEAHVRGLPAHTSFYAPRPLPARGPRRLLGAVLWRIRRSDLLQGWRRALHEHLPDVVLAEYGPTGVAVMRACHHLGVPLVVYFHGYDATNRRTVKRFRKDYQTLFRYAVTIVAASPGLIDRLRLLGAPETKLRYLPCGVDTTRFSGARPDQASAKVVAVGRLVEKKAPDLTIRAFARAQREHPEAQLVMIGDGPLRARCESLIEELALGPHVRLLGAQPHDVVLREMRSARLFAQHSVRADNGDTEGTPVAVTEAQSCGLPVVATRHEGISDVVEHDVTGFLVEEHDDIAMSRAMVLLLEEGALARDMGSRGRAKVEQRFDERKTLASLAELLRVASQRP